MKLLFITALIFMNINISAQITEGLYVSSEDSFKKNFYLYILGDSITLFGWDLLFLDDTSVTDTIHYKACTEYSMLDSSYISMNFENHEFSRKSFLSENFDSMDIIDEINSDQVFPYVNMFGGIMGDKLLFYGVKSIYLSNTDNFIFELQTDTLSLFSSTIQGLKTSDSTYAIKSLCETYPELFEPVYDTTVLIQCTALLKEVYPTQKCRQSFVFTFKVIEGIDDSMTYDGLISVELWDDAAVCFMEFMEFEEAENETISPSFYGMIFPDKDIYLILKLHEKCNPRDYYLEDAVLIEEQK